MAFEQNDVNELSEMFDEMTSKVKTVVKLTAMQLFRNVILKTPVDSGRARGNWTCSLNSPVETATDKIDKRGNDAINKMTAVVNEVELGKSVYLSNNLPYIGKLEYGEFTDKDETEKTIGGFSKQAPNGMVRISIQELKDDFSKIVGDA